MRSGIAGDHLRTIQRVRSDTRECRPVELAGANEVGIRPNGEFGIIRKSTQRSDGITEIGARGIGSLRNRDAIKERRGARRELGEQPAIGQLIVENNGIAGVLGLTRAAKSSPELIVCERTHERSPGLVKDLEAEVGHGDDVVGTHIAVGIRRRRAGAGLPIKADNRRWDIYSANRGLHHRVRHERRDVGRDGATIVIALALGPEGFNRCHIAQGLRDIKMDHREEALVDASMFGLKSRLRLLRLGLSGADGVQAKPEQRECDADQAKTQAN